MRAKVEAYIVISAWSMYLLLVWHGKAQIEGFVALTVYLIKKFLDLLEVNGNQQQDQKEVVK